MKTENIKHRVRRNEFIDAIQITISEEEWITCEHKTKEC